MPSETSKAVTIQILGKDYHVSCAPDEELDLRRAASELNGKMSEIKANGKTIGLERIAVMAALNISHELLQKDSELQTLKQDTQARLGQLTNSLDNALADNA
ncbi:MAG: cell division protein ZapA [Gammaproteobacteria bacterium]|nr:cell division protein ZapA [Gammaproteobacteria bacterium]